MESVNKLTCDVCQKTFVNVYSKNRHLRDMHDKKVEKNMSQHIRCSLCPEEKKEALPNHDILLNHLKEIHGVTIKQSDLSFRNIAEFETWMSKENRQVDYACVRRNKHANGNENVYYNCNRSNSFGYKSRCTVKTEKLGGSIKISGICPSRIIVKIFRNGSLSAKFMETHVGHADELRSKRLTKQEQTMIVDQLQTGRSKERILHDARKMKDIELKRINLIRREDLDYLMKKFNIDKKRHADDMVASASKIEEGKNQKNVDEKLWKNILNIERPNANNYKHRINVKTHREGEEMIDFVESVEFGRFRVKSTTGDKFYIIKYNELCDEHCRTAYCYKCKICLHRYICDCPEFSVKPTLCKHIHAVVIYERRRSESTPGVNSSGVEDSEGILYIDESTTSEIRHKEELIQFFEEKDNEPNTSMDSETSKQILIENLTSFIKSLNGESFQKFADHCMAFKNNLERENNNKVCKKRKIEKQTYFPNKK